MGAGGLERENAGIPEIGELVDEVLGVLVAELARFGEFRVFWSESTEIPEIEANRASSPFVAAMILLALERLPDQPKLRLIRDHSIRFLLSHRKENGAIGFFRTGIAPDLDDICLIHSLLQRFGVPLDYAKIVRRVRAMRLEDGRFPTWLETDLRMGDIDPIVNLNVLRFLALNGVEEPKTILWLNRQLLSWDFSDGTRYYRSPFSLPYIFATLPRKLRGRILSGPEIASLHAKLGSMKHLAEDAIDRANLLFALAKFGSSTEELEPLIAALLADRPPGGGWPSLGAWWAFNNWGSSSLTSALALQPLYLLSRTAWKLRAFADST